MQKWVLYSYISSQKKLSEKNISDTLFERLILESAFFRQTTITIKTTLTKQCVRCLYVRFKPLVLLLSLCCSAIVLVLFAFEVLWFRLSRLLFAFSLCIFLYRFCSMLLLYSYINVLLSYHIMHSPTCLLYQQTVLNINTSI